MVDSGRPDAATFLDAGAGDAGPAPVLVFTTSPVAGLPAGVQFARAVPYGPDSEQVMDVFLPPSATPTPAVLSFHGGGFIEGSRTNAYGGTAAALRRVVDAGIAWIGVDYRLLEAAGTEDAGVLKSLKDSQRSLQFVRQWAQTFNVRGDRIAAYGTSAGAGTSLWLAYHPEMAQPASPDAIARRSTRIRAAAAVSTQSTYDVLRWSPDVFAPTYPIVTNGFLFAVPRLREMVVRFYGLPGALANDQSALLARLQTPALAAYRAEVDMLALMSADDPPVFVQNTDANVSPLSADFDLLHHPLHARALRTRAMQVGATMEADIPAFNVDASQTAMGFLIDRLRAP